LKKIGDPWQQIVPNQRGKGSATIEEEALPRITLKSHGGDQIERVRFGGDQIYRAPIRASRHGRPILHLLHQVLPPIHSLFFFMAGIDLNEPINWDELEDFDGEARELAGDFFFEVDIDEG
jgi:hypothetical protein